MALLRARVEALGYVILGVGLVALLAARVQQLDGFFVDEWIYVHGAEYIWEQLPLGPLDQIPGWNRGPQRLYSVVLAATWGPLDPSTAYTLSHLLNVALLVSGIWPAALLARRVIDEPAMRVLAVALAVAVPWLLISANLLTENLAFPLFLWTVWAIVVAAEEPGWAAQFGALACVVALTLCRLNLAFMLAVLIIAVLAAEVVRWRSAEPGAFRLRVALRRRAPTVAALVLGVLGVVVVITGGGSRFGAYGGFASSSILEAVWGDTSDATGRAALSYFRSLAAGCFVFPLVLGLATALAGARGRLGVRLVIPGLVALAGFVGALAVVSIWTGSAALEERYVFYVYSPLAILAVASVRRLPRMLPDIAIAGAVVVFAMARGIDFPATASFNFFAAPAGAFWTRVVDHRIRALERDVFGIVPGAGEGWLLLAGGVAALLVVAYLAGRHARLRTLVASGLVLCVLAQLAVLHYDFDKLLHGTPEAPGGLARSADRSLDRETWIDDALPDGSRAAIVPAVATPALPYADAERQQFWNKSLDASVTVGFAFVPMPVAPGFETVRAGIQDGLATWEGPRYDWLAAQPGDPRLQYAGRLVARARGAPYGLYRLDGPPTAVWTGTGIDYDGAVRANVQTVMTLNRNTAEDTRAVTLRLRAPAELSKAVRWRIERAAGDRVASGRLSPGATTTARLRVSECRRTCPDRDVWRLITGGGTAPLLAPYYGEPPPPRPVRLFFESATLVR